MNFICFFKFFIYWNWKSLMKFNFFFLSTNQHKVHQFRDIQLFEQSSMIRYTFLNERNGVCVIFTAYWNDFGARGLLKVVSFAAAIALKHGIEFFFMTLMQTYESEQLSHSKINFARWRVHIWLIHVYLYVDCNIFRSIIVFIHSSGVISSPSIAFYRNHRLTSSQSL